MPPLASHALLYPGLADAVLALGRALCVIGGRDVKASLSAVTPTSPVAAREQPCVRIGATGSAVLELSPDMLHPLVESFLGMRAHATRAHTVTASELRLLRTHLVPALRPVLATVNPAAAAAFTLTEATGTKAWAQVRTERLVEVRIVLSIDGVTGPLTVVLPAAEQSGPVPHAPAVAAAAAVPIPLTVQLPGTTLSAARLRALAVGDLITLAPTTSAPWLLYAAHTLIAAGRLGQHQHRVAVTLDTLWRTPAMTAAPADLTSAAETAPAPDATASTDRDLGVVGDVQIEVTVQAGQVTMPLREVLALQEGQVIPLNRAPAAPVDVLANGTKVATAEAMTVDGRHALRILSLVAPQ